MSFPYRLKPSHSDQQTTLAVRMPRQPERATRNSRFDTVKGPVRLLLLRALPKSPQIKTYTPLPKPRLRTLLSLGSPMRNTPAPRPRGVSHCGFFSASPDNLQPHLRRRIRAKPPRPSMTIVIGSGVVTNV